MEQQSFKIKLDDLDINPFLRAIVRSGVSPLWDLSARTNYREFQVFVGQKPELCDDARLTSYKQYKCPLCKVDVPMMHQKEHNSSPKHITCVEIAKAVMERVNNNITVDNDYCNDKIPNTYFCEACATIVKNDDKIHESSNSHCRSLLRDRLLSDMLIVYERNDYEETDFCVLFKNDLCKEEFIVTNYEKPVLAVDNNENYMASLNHTCLLPPKITKQDIIPDFDETEEEISEKGYTCLLPPKITKQDIIPDFDETEEEISEKGSCGAAPFPTGDASSGSTDGTRKKDEREKNYCEPCNLHVDKHNYHSHLQSKKHARNEKLKQAKSNLTNARKLVKCETSDETNNNPTNKTKNPTNKTKNPTDKTKNLTAESKPNKRETSYIHSISTKLITKTNANQTATPKNNTSGAKNAIEAQSNNSEIQFNSNEAESTKLPYYHVQLTGDNMVFCRVCVKRFEPNSITSINSHLKGQHHVTNFYRILSLNKVSILPDSTLHCYYCKIGIALQKELAHIASANHKAYTRRTNTDKITIFNCLVCQILIPNAPLIKKMHEETAEHKSNVLWFDNINPKFKKVVLHHHFEMHQSQILCKVCDILIDVALYKLHRSSDAHWCAHRAILQENLLKRQQIGFKCHYCQEIILADDDLNHVRSERHLLKKSVVPYFRLNYNTANKSLY